MDQQLLYNITCGFVAYTRRVQQIRLPEFPNPFDLLELSPQNRIPSTYALSGSLERILPHQGRFLCHFPSGSPAVYGEYGALSIITPLRCIRGFEPCRRMSST